MSLPNVLTYSVATGNATYIVNAAAATNAPLALNHTTLPGFPLQQRVLVTSTGNDSSLFFRILGLNQAGFTVSEFLAGSNATYAQSNLDYAAVISIQGSSSSTVLTPSATANSVSVGVSTNGVNGVGSTLWNIMNWHATPTNIEVSGVVVGTQGVTWTAQYCYDDPNNLPSGVPFPQPFNHPTLLNQTATLDGPINDPVTGVRLTINGGTGTVRFTVIQAGIGSP
jgi:hypothetical protein